MNMSPLIKQPGVYIEEISVGTRPIQGVSTSTVAFVGETQKGPTAPTRITSWLQFQKVFGGYFGSDKYLPHAVEGFFLNGGQRCYIRKTDSDDYSTALVELEGLDEIALIYSPNAQAVPNLADLLIDHCERLRNRFVILDSIKGQTPSSVSKPRCVSSYAALYYPWIKIRQEATRGLYTVPPGGHIAGIFARTDSEVGVHKAPANQVVKGAMGLEFSVNAAQQDTLNPQGINCIRSFTGRGILVWGARTLTSDLESRYVNVQRLLIYFEQSIKRGTAWTAFEPNNEATWAKVRMASENFLYTSWHDGQLMGAKPQEAYFVKCDRSTMTQNDIDNGKLNILIGVAPIRPAEFIILRVQHTATK